MVLVDFTKEELYNLIETFDHDNWLDYDEDGSLKRLRDKIWNYYEQKNFVYLGDELLNEESGKEFLEELERKPTQKQIDDLKDAVKFARKIKTFTKGYCYSCEKEELDWYRDVCTECFKKIESL